MTGIKPLVDPADVASIVGEAIGERAQHFAPITARNDAPAHHWTRDRILGFVA